MNSDDKFRFHMGCGEPLRSRWWVAKQVQCHLSAQQHSSKAPRSRSAGDASRRGGKGKS